MRRGKGRQAVLAAWIVVFAAVLCLACPVAGRAADRGGVEDSSNVADGGNGEDSGNVADYMEELDFGEIEEFLKQEQGQSSLTFSAVMKRLLAGDLTGLLTEAGASLRAALFSEITAGSKMMAQILALGIFGAIFTNFSSVFGSGQISETGFFITYLTLFVFLTVGVSQSITVAAEAVDTILSFMRALSPAYFMAVACAGGSVTAAAMYEFTLLSLTVGQWLLSALLIPLVRIFLLLSLAGNLVKEAFFSKLTELSGMAVNWGVKTLLGAVLGFHLIQSLILPYVDAMKHSSVQKLMTLIPGVGQGAAAVTQMLLGSGVLIKNTMGIAAVVFLFLLAAVPVGKLVILYVVYQLLAAVMEPVCDKRMVDAVTAAAKANRMLLTIVMAAALLLILTVAVVCAGTNVTYYA